MTSQSLKKSNRQIMLFCDYQFSGAPAKKSIPFVIYKKICLVLIIQTDFPVIVTVASQLFIFLIAQN